MIESKENESTKTILKLFRAALISHKIYPPGSKIIQDRTNSLYDSIKEFLAASDNLNISQAGHSLLINGKEIDSNDSELIPIFKSFMIQAITFHKDVTKDEIKFLMDTLSKPKEQMVGDLGELLQKTNINNIRINTLTYVALDKDEKVISKISNLIDSASENPQVFMKYLHETYETIEEVENPKMKKDVINMLVKKLATLESSNLKDFFEQELPQKIESSGLKNAVITTMTEGKIRDIYYDVMNWYKEIKENAKSEFEAAENLTSLRRFINKILTSPAAKQLPFSFFEELLKIGLIENIPDYKEQKEDSILFKVDELLEKNNLELLDPSISGTLHETIRKLYEAEIDDSAEKLIIKIAGNLEQSSLKIKNSTVKTLLKISGVLLQLQKEKMLKFMQTIMLKDIGIEPEPDLFREAAQFLQNRLVYFMFNNNYEEAINILTAMKSTSAQQDQTKIEIMNSILGDIAKQVSGILLNDMMSPMEKNRNHAIRLLTMLGRNSTEILADVIKNSADQKARKMAVFMLKNMDIELLKSIFANISQELSTEIILRVLDALETVPEVLNADKLSELMYYPDPEVRKKTAQYLFKMKSEDGKKHLLKLINDEDLGLQKTVVRYLGELKYEESAAELGKLIENTKSAELQEEICIALSKIPGTVSLTSLLKLLKSRKGMFGRGKIYPDTVRVHAIIALRNFGYNSDIESVLVQLQKESNVSISNSAKDALGFFRKN